MKTSGLPIRVRLALWYAAVLFVSLGAFGGFVYLFLSRTIDRDTKTILLAHVAQIGSSIEVSNSQIRVTESDGISTPGTYFSVFNMNGALIAGSAQVLSEINASPSFGSFRLATFRGQRWIYYDRPIENDNNPVGWIRAARDVGQSQETLHSLAVGFIVFIPLLVLLAVTGGLMFSRRALSPIDHVTRIASAIGGGDLSRRIEVPRSNDEVGRLVRTLNDMLGKLENAFRRERQFTSDASHELRTPISVIVSQAEAALHGKPSAGRLSEALSGILHEALRMGAMVAQLLAMARLEIARDKLDIELLDLLVIAEEIANTLSEKALKAGVLVAIEPFKAPQINGDQTLITRMLINLLDNAIKYNKPGGSVSIAALPDGEDVIVRVSDTGVGISPDDLPHVFDRFYRVTHSSKQVGSGLGLAIVKSIAEAHGGRASARSVLGEGTTIQVRLPADPRKAGRRCTREA